jgi:hypothetical protein
MGEISIEEAKHEEHECKGLSKYLMECSAK